jgi:LysM repeat protein
MRVTPHHVARAISTALLFAVLVGLSPARPAYADPVIHTVQPGENLFRIGLKYGVAWQAIQQANGLNGIYIYVGQQLIIPVEGQAPAVPDAVTAVPPPPTPAPPEPAPVAPPAPAVQSYTVQPGDTLFRIATRFGLEWQALAAANNLGNPGMIYAGQTLTIPAAGQSAPNAPPLPATASAGRRILVDLSEQHLYAFDGDQLVFSFVASTGAPGMGTRPGNYHVQSKIPNAYGGNWNIWMPNWLGIYWAGSLENGIHALPILPGGSRLWDGYLGTPVSYGCVILGIAEAQQLYDWAEIGVPVDIQY